jgi:hypothetical protein
VEVKGLHLWLSQQPVELGQPEPGGALSAGPAPTKPGLKAGIMTETGPLAESDTGTPKGHPLATVRQHRAQRAQLRKTTPLPAQPVRRPIHHTQLV